MKETEKKLEFKFRVGFLQTAEEGGHLREQSIEAPIIGGVGCSNGIDGFGCQHRFPWNDLLLCVCNICGTLDVVELFFRDKTILGWT